MKFGTIIADPPWAYSRSSKKPSQRGYSDKQYEPLTTKSLALLPVADIVTKDSVLFLWTTGPFLADGSATTVVKGWGFKPVTIRVWRKIKADGSLHQGGVGHWYRGNSEFIVIGKRDKAYRWNKMKNWQGEDFSNIFDAPKSLHSVKPPMLHECIERSSYPGPCLEMFGRCARDGWTVIGNEAPGYKGEDIKDALLRLATA